MGATTPTSSGRSGAGDRVVRSHAQTRATLAPSLAFLGAAAIAAAGGASRWLVVHLALAGGVVLAVAAVSLMLAVTWSAAPAPPGRVVRVMRGSLGVGAAGICVARSTHAPAGVLGVAGGVYLAGLALLAGLLVRTIARGSERRFDPAVGGYLLALVAGLAGVTIGIAMATGAASPARRSAHVTVNLLGLVGLVVAATAPYFAATVGRARMSARARPAILWTTVATMAGGVAVAAIALARRAADVAAYGFAVYAVGVVTIVAVLPRLTRRQLRWAGPRLLALWFGAAWWTLAVAATAVDAAADRPVLTGRWLGALVLGGYLQILWGSLAYVVPMLRGGGPEHLSAGFATTRSWTGLAAANATAIAAAAEAPAHLPTLFGAVWAIDTAWRLTRVGLRRAARPPL